MRRLLAVVLLVAGTYSVPAQNLSDRIAACLSCHGDDGQSYIVGTPSLGAEPALFVMIQLYLFREKQRQVEPMTQAAQRLSDDDLRSLSDMIAKLPPPKPPEEPVDAARIERAWSLVRKHHCLFCHNSDFSGHENVPGWRGNARITFSRRCASSRAIRARDTTRRWPKWYSRSVMLSSPTSPI
jgi:cytochrome c553